MHHPCIKLNSYCIKQCVSCRDHCSPSSGVFIATTASLLALWVATVTVFGVVTAVLSWQHFKLKQKGMQTAKPYRWYRDDNYNECFNMHAVVKCWFSLSLSVSRQRNPSHSSPPLLFLPKSVQLQPNPSYCSVERGHQWQCNSCMLEWMYVCTYVSQRNNTVLYWIL